MEQENYTLFTLSLKDYREMKKLIKNKNNELKKLNPSRKSLNFEKGEEPTDLASNVHMMTSLELLSNSDASSLELLLPSKEEQKMLFGCLIKTAIFVMQPVSTQIHLKDMKVLRRELFILEYIFDLYYEFLKIIQNTQMMDEKKKRKIKIAKFLTPIMEEVSNILI